MWLSGRRGTRTREKGFRGGPEGGVGRVMKSMVRVDGGVVVVVDEVRNPCIRGMVMLGVLVGRWWVRVWDWVW